MPRVPARRGGEKWRPPAKPLERWSELDWRRLLEQGWGIRKRDAGLREEIRQAVDFYIVLLPRDDTPRVSAEKRRAKAGELAMAARSAADLGLQLVFSEFSRIGFVGALLVILVPEVVAGRMTGGDLLLEPVELARLAERAQ